VGTRWKGWDPLEEVKKGAAERWVSAVNADGTFGRWRYAVAKKPSDVITLLDAEGAL
jgi:type III restriction enzyme